MLIEDGIFIKQVVNMNKINKLICTGAIATASLFSTQAISAPINLADDAYQSVSIGFDFDFFGNTYSDVFIGSNGFLTFGNGDTNWIESVSRFLNEDARIAVWDDFNPAAGGTISTSSTADSFKVSYDFVPEFYNTGSNSFDITLFSNGSIDIFFESLTTNDLLVGISDGNGVGSSVDFSSLTTLSASEVTYQRFTNEFDLNGQTLHFAVDVPAPTTLAVFGLSLFGLALRRRKTS